MFSFIFIIQVLRNLVKEILFKCTELGANSLALPAIGAGQHGFPEEVVFRVYKEEIEIFSGNKFFQMILQDIRVVVFREGSGNASGNQLIYHHASRIVPTGDHNRVISFGQVRVFLKEGDITHHSTPSDAVINILPRNLQLSTGGGVCTSILKAGGQQIQEQLNAFRDYPVGSVIPTGAGSMTNVEQILHVVPTSNDVAGLQRSIEECLMEAKALFLGSVSVSAIGTSSNINPRDSAEVILNAAEKFSNANYSLVVNIVVFQKKMIADFEESIKRKVNRTAYGTLPPQFTLNTSNISRRSIIGGLGNPDTPQRIDYKELKNEEAKEVIQLTFVANSQGSIDKSVREVQKFTRDHISKKKIKHEKALDVLRKNWESVGNLARTYKVSLRCASPSEVVLEGLVTDVVHCAQVLLGLMDAQVGEERIHGTNYSGILLCLMVDDVTRYDKVSV